MHALEEFERLVDFLLVTSPDRAPTVECLFWHLRELYREIPGLALSSRDVKEAFHASDRVCELALHALVDARFLQRASHGRLVRTAVA